MTCKKALKRDCFGDCPDPIPFAAAICRRCDCGGGVIEALSIKRCTGACPGCSNGCTEITDAGGTDAADDG
jgi:hypothetical protein